MTTTPDPVPVTDTLDVVVRIVADAAANGDSEALGLIRYAYSCRCDPCRAAASERNRRNYQARKQRRAAAEK